jgi:hypothetical protein
VVNTSYLYATFSSLFSPPKVKKQSPDLTAGEFNRSDDDVDA